MLEASRVSVGDQNNYGFEVRGTKGFLAWDFRRMGELLVSLGEDYLDQPADHRVRRTGPRRVRAFPARRGHRHELRRPQGHRMAGFLKSIEAGRPPEPPWPTRWPAPVPSDAMAESVRTGRWVDVRPD